MVSERSKIIKKRKRRNRLQHPKQQLDHSPVAEQNPNIQWLLQNLMAYIPTRNQKTNFTMCTYNCKVIGTRLAHLMREKFKCFIFGLCKTHWKEELNTRWTERSIVRQGKVQGVSAIGGIGFIISKEWVANVILYKLLLSCIGVQNIQLSFRHLTKIRLTISQSINSIYNWMSQSVWHWSPAAIIAFYRWRWSMTKPERRQNYMSPWKTNISRSSLRWYCKIPSGIKIQVILKVKMIITTHW